MNAKILIAVCIGVYAGNIYADCSGIPRFTIEYSECTIQELLAQAQAESEGGGLVTQEGVVVGLDLSYTVVPNVTNSVSGNVVSENFFGLSSAVIKSDGSLVSQYGYLQLNANGEFIYTLYDKAESVTSLQVGDVVTDKFSYSVFTTSGQSASATLTFYIIGNPVDPEGNTVLPQTQDQVYDFADVDIEFNDSAAQATALTSARMIKGHLHDSNDQDWFILPSNGNEVISLEVCPQGSTCFGKKRWVLYVFDADWFQPSMAGAVQLDRWVDETGTTRDLTGQQIISGVSSAGSSNQLYLNYRSGFFSGALIGIVDPCFDTLNSVDIGVPNQAKNYLIAISNPLHGDADASSGECGQGDVVLKRGGLNAAGLTEDADGKTSPKSYTTTEEYVSVYRSDDQYTVRITGTGLHPLLSEQAQANAATYNAKTGELVLPKVRVGNKVVQVLGQENPIMPRSGDGSLEFILSGIVELGLEELADAYQAIYNPDNGQVVIPIVTDTESGDSYSVICQYHPAADGYEAWLEVLSTELIQ